MTKRDEDLRIYINGHLQFSARDEFNYHELLIHAPMTAAIEQEPVLVPGDAEGLALRKVLRSARTRQVNLVDLDPAIDCVGQRR